MYENSHGVRVGQGNAAAGSGAGTYAWAMREFAQCASVTPEPLGYCHGSITSADKLANHDVCTGGATTNSKHPQSNLPLHVAGRPSLIDFLYLK